MERGVYVAEFAGLKEISVVDGSGKLIRRMIVTAELFTGREVDELRTWLERVDQPRRLRLL